MIRVIGILLLVSAAFGLGYYLAPGEGPPTPFERHVQDLTSTVTSTSSAIKRDMTMRRRLVNAHSELMVVNEELNRKNFGSAREGIDRTLILLGEARDLPDTDAQTRSQLENMRERLLVVHKDVETMNPSAPEKIRALAADLEHLRATQKSF